MTDPNYNFNKPLEIVELFRMRQTTPSETEPDGNGGVVVTQVQINTKDYSHRSAVLWENIEALRDYCYEDDWVAHQGPKYYMTVAGQEEDVLVLGSYDTMLEYWTAYRETLVEPVSIPIHDMWNQWNQKYTGDFPNFPVTTSTDLPDDTERT